MVRKHYLLQFVSYYLYQRGFQKLSRKQLREVFIERKGDETQLNVEAKDKGIYRLSSA